jgi:hypothetical protein
VREPSLRGAPSHAFGHGLDIKAYCVGSYKGLLYGRTDRVRRYAHRIGRRAKDGIDRIGHPNTTRRSFRLYSEFIECGVPTRGDLRRDVRLYGAQRTGEGLDLRRDLCRSPILPTLNGALVKSKDVAELLLGKTQGHTALNDESARDDRHARHR